MVPQNVLRLGFTPNASADHPKSHNFMLPYLSKRRFSGSNWNEDYL